MNVASIVLFLIGLFGLFLLVMGLLSVVFAGEGYVNAIAVGERVLSENVFLPVVAAVRRDVKLVNLDARGVVQGKVLLALREGRGGEQHREGADDDEGFCPAEAVGLCVFH